MSATEVIERTEVIDAAQAEALAGLLGVQAPTELLPEMWHWVYLMERRPHADLGPDGHPSFGIPAPPGEGRRRMWAGGRVVHREQLAIGEPATKTTRIASSVEKEARSGPMTLVTVRNEITQGGRTVIVDEQDIVYLVASGSVPLEPGTLDLPPAATERAPVLDLRVDEALLFRFSALTYNAHRIHYDHTWCRVEGYADLVVHGPLQALMMGELIRRHGAGLVGREFAYRLVSPMIGPQVLRVVPAAEGLDRGAEVLEVGGRVTAKATLSAGIVTAPGDAVQDGDAGKRGGVLQ
ncbi:MAG: MaoC family dehydratase N-terminal domain-containing protein [Tetrasphaera sp.]